MTGAPSLSCSPSPLVCDVLLQMDDAPPGQQRHPDHRRQPHHGVRVPPAQADGVRVLRQLLDVLRPEDQGEVGVCVCVRQVSGPGVKLAWMLSTFLVVAGATQRQLCRSLSSQLWLNVTGSACGLCCLWCAAGLGQP